MAIVFDEQKRSVNWFGIVAGLFLVIFFFVGVYYLFFAPVPKIQSIIPAALQDTTQLSKLEYIDPSTILDNPTFRKLHTYVPLPGPGRLGRSNPFLSF